MALIRWDPQDVDRFREDMNRMWSRLRDEWNFDQTRPRTHLHPTDDGYLVEFELPGVDPNDVSIDVDADTVNVRGQFPASLEENDPRQGEPFHAVVSFPSEIDPETAEAHYRHGLLSVKVFKLSGRRRRLNIKEAARDGAGTSP